MSNSPKEIPEELPVEPSEEINGDQVEQGNKKSRKVKKGSSGENRGKRDQEKVPQGAMEAGQEDEPESPDDLMEDVRRSLVEEERQKDDRSFLSRLKKRVSKISKKSKAPHETEKVETDIPPLSVPEDPLPETKPKERSKSIEEQEEEILDEFFSELETLASVEEAEPSQVDDLEKRFESLGMDDLAEEARVARGETETESVEQASLPGKKLKDVLPAADEKSEEDYEDIRGIALEEYTETTLQGTSDVEVSIRGTLRDTVREMRPVERMILIAVFVIAVVMALASGVYLIINSMPPAEPAITPTPGNIPYPVGISLPGGWTFDLGRGRVVEGVWEPQGAEWLEGTELCRWVSLPYSLQLEAVLRTLNRDDQIELQMSNYDRLGYNVQSIQEMSLDDLQKVDTMKPCLLVILSGDSESPDTRWVITAVP